MALLYNRHIIYPVADNEVGPLLVYRGRYREAAEELPEPRI